jgi:hypothetical protein
VDSTFNVRKSIPLCVNTTQKLLQDLQQKGFNTWQLSDTLGLVRETLKKMNRKAMAMTPPTNIFHRAALICTAGENPDPLQKEIISFLRTRNVETITIQKRRLIASKCLAASFDKEGQQIQQNNLEYEFGAL